MRVTMDEAGRVVVPKPIRDAAGLTGGQEVEIRLAGAAIEIEPVKPAARMRERRGRLPILEVEGEVGPVNGDDVRSALEAQRREREERPR